MLHTGNCLDVMATMEPSSIDTIVTDPPYGLSFMGKAWDHGVPGVEFWIAALRVAKPGAFLIAFGGTRTFHRLACEIEDAGWELRDTIGWIYGSGFPKSLDISKAIDKANGAEREIVGRRTDRAATPKRDMRGGNYVGASTNIDLSAITAPATEAAKEWDGYGTALKPAWEPIIVAMKPVDRTFANNALAHGIAGINVDGCRIDAPAGNGVWGSSNKTVNPDRTFVGSPEADEYRTEQHPLGRFPANIIHDGSEEVLAVFPQSNGQQGNLTGQSKDRISTGIYSDMPAAKEFTARNDTGSAARFFYCAKASRSEREDGMYGTPEKPMLWSSGEKNPGSFQSENTNRKAKNNHPTVKPIALMRYLVRLTRTPKGGVVLDPFTGSGSTGVACALEGRDFIGIDVAPEYVEIAKKRIAHAELQPDFFK